MVSNYSKLPEKEKQRMRKAHREWAKRNPRTEYYKKYDQSRDYKQVLVTSSRGRASKAGVPHTITKNDFEIPENCPICEHPMSRSNVRGGHRGSPTLDRVRPELGYVPGNVAIICKNCNSKKGHATAEELRKIADWIESFA